VRRPRDACGKAAIPAQAELHLQPLGVAQQRDHPIGAVDAAGRKIVTENHDGNGHGCRADLAKGQIDGRGEHPITHGIWTKTVTRGHAGSAGTRGFLPNRATGRRSSQRRRQPGAMVISPDAA